MGSKEFKLYLSRSEDVQEDSILLSRFKDFEGSQVITAGTADPCMFEVPYNHLVLTCPQGEKYSKQLSRTPKDISFVNIRFNKNKPPEFDLIDFRLILEKFLCEGNCSLAIILCHAVVERFIRDLADLVFKSKGVSYEPFKRSSMSMLNDFLLKMRIIEPEIHRNIKSLIEKRNEFVHKRAVESLSYNPEEVRQIIDDGLDALKTLWIKIKELKEK